MTLHHGDCLDILPTLEADSIDSCCTDPPYGISFMSKNWDHGIPGEHFWIEVLRVLKPGAHLLAFGGTRTYHRLTCAIEDAGFEIRDCLMYVFGSGFPKSHDVSKAIDELYGAEREVVGANIASHDGYNRNPAKHGDPHKNATSWAMSESNHGLPLTAPSTEDAKKWDGFGTALKPAYEPIILARKPFKGTVAQNVLEYGTGALNIDASRVPADYSNEVNLRPNAYKQDGKEIQNDVYGNGRIVASQDMGYHNSKGRWPANFIHDGSDEVTRLFPDTHSTAAPNCTGKTYNKQSVPNTYGKYNDIPYPLDLINDKGGSAARFFYCAKSSKAERNAGCEGMESKRVNKMGSFGNQEGFDCPDGANRVGDKGSAIMQNTHPCVKPISLMRYLCKLITPPKGIVLDPFMGSGSTGMACVEEGFEFIGIELDKHYHEIAENRINNAQPTLF